VKILTTTWCGVCKKAKAYLAGKGIYFSEYDVETSDIGRQEYKRLGGKGVPIILVGKQRMDGFSSSRLDEMLKNVGYP
jgi:glutaredoxin